MTVLGLDFGNTRQKAAVWEKGVTQPTLYSLERQDLSGAVQRLAEQCKPVCCVLSSVIHHTPELTTCLEGHTRLIDLSKYLPPPLIMPAAFKGKMGADRVALALAAMQAFPGRNCLVISLGTCITYNFINKAGVFLGGRIAPGLQMRLDMMHEKTALLPLVAMEQTGPIPLIGYNTETHLSGGTVAGVLYEIQGNIADISAQWQEVQVVLTGGDSGWIDKNKLKKTIFVDELFLFKGLYAAAYASL